MVFSINGRRILSQFDYDQALIDAAMYRGGLVSLTVRNIRFDYGQSFQEFVNVSTVLPGYGGVYPVAGAQAGPVAARLAGGQRQGQVGQRQGQVIQGQTRFAQARSQVREVARDKVPAMKSGDSGSSQ